MLDRLEDLRRRGAEISEELSDPNIFSNPDRLAELGRQHAELLPILDAYDQYLAVRQTVQEAHELIEGSQDDEEVVFFRCEAARAQKELEQLDEHIRELLVPEDPFDARNVIVEIRSAVGGDEAGLFAADLARMYARFAERKGWVVDMLTTARTPLGGLREAIFTISGRGAYGALKHEGGTHRVQRVPRTEASGRTHTSTVTVAVLPEAKSIEVDLDHSDLQIDAFRSSGPGGQSVNTTDSAIRITHMPTGIVVTCQDQKSQLQNKEKAMVNLRARLLRIEEDRTRSEMSAERREQIGSGDRSERIRTYNFAQNRVTDHRLGMSKHDIEAVLDGDLDDFIRELRADERAQNLASIDPV